MVIALTLALAHALALALVYKIIITNNKNPSSLCQQNNRVREPVT
jgi:hypothetical protein